MTNPRTPANATAARRLLTNIERDLRARLGTKDAIDGMLRRSRHVVTMALIPSQYDGWGSTTPGNGSPGGGSGRHITVEDEHGQPDRVPVTSVELAVFNRERQGDGVTEIGRLVLAELTTIQSALWSLENHLNAFDHQRSTAKVEDAPQCHVAKGYGLPWDETWTPFRSSDLGGELDEPRRLCKFTYWFHRDNGRLPTKAEMLKHLERGTVRVSA